jgi:hypothetical protein
MESTTKYQRVKPGLYFQGTAGAGQNFPFKLIYVLSARHEQYERRQNRPAWKGVVYSFFDFADKTVSNFNEYWDDFIDTLYPVTDEIILHAAQRVLRHHRENLMALNADTILALSGV